MNQLETEVREALLLLEQRVPHTFDTAVDDLGYPLTDADTVDDFELVDPAPRRSRRLLPALSAAVIAVVLASVAAVAVHHVSNRSAAQPASPLPSHFAPAPSFTGDGAVATATRFMKGEPLPAPAASQRKLLAKKTLTHQDYLAAEQATVDCVTRAGLSNTSLAFPTSPNGDDLRFTAEEFSIGDGLASYRLIGGCAAKYSAYVAQRWAKQVEQTLLTPAQEAIQKTSYVTCLNRAGARVPTDISDSALEKIIDTPGGFSRYLTVSFSGSDIDSCATRYPILINTLHRR